MKQWLSAFFERIQYRGNEQITFYELPQLMEQFAKHVPFENVDVIEKRDFVIEQNSLQEKIVTNARGGLCYELNPFFYYVLKELGFSVSMFAGTVGERNSPLQKTHIAILLQHENEKYVIDVGFGSNLSLKPLPFTGEFVTSVTGSYRIVPSEENDDEFIYEKYVNNERASRYFFTLDPIDEAHVNHVKDLIMTHPKSNFNKSLLLIKITEQGHMTLTDHSFTTVENGKRNKREIDIETVKRLSEEEFGITLQHMTN